MQAMARARFEAQHGAARTVAEAAGPLHLHARPPPPPLVRPARVPYTALLSRFQQDAAAKRMSSFRDPADSDSEPGGNAELDGLTSGAAPGERRKHVDCRVCRSVDHDTQRCPVVWLAGYAGNEPGTRPVLDEHGTAEQQQTEECPWMARVPGSIKNIMDAMQQYAADTANEHASGHKSRSVRSSALHGTKLPHSTPSYVTSAARRHAGKQSAFLAQVKRSFSPEALLAAALLVDETLKAAANGH